LELRKLMPLGILRKLTSQGKTMGSKANGSDEYIFTNTPEVKTTFPGCALLLKKIGCILF